MSSLKQLKIISKITHNFVNCNPGAINLFDYLVSYISSSKTDFQQRKLLLDVLKNNIHNQKTFLFHVAYHYYLNINGGENSIELTRDNIIDDYYREVNALIVSVKNNSRSEKKKIKMELLIERYLSHVSILESETFDPISSYEHSSNIILLDHYLPEMHSNDCWGYTSPSGTKYSLMGYFDKLSIFRIVNDKLVLISEITHDASIWSDVKVYENYCYCVNETGGGIQVISLEQIDNWTYPYIPLVTTITNVSVDNETKSISTAHNVYVDENNGILYVLGSIDSTDGTEGGQDNKLLNRHPEYPSLGYNYTFALKSSLILGASVQQPIFLNSESTFFQDLVTYTYNDSKTYAFASGKDTGIHIIDVTEPRNWVHKHILIDYKQYTGVDGYMHQIWYSSNGRYIFANDESLNNNTIIVYDLKPFLDNDTVPPQLILFNSDGTVNDNGNLWSNGQISSNHNLYIHYIDGKDHIFHSCYKNGLRLHQINTNTFGDIISIKEIGYFDTYYQSNGSGTSGQWSNYYWNDHERLMIVSDTENGTFLLKYISESE